MQLIQAELTKLAAQVTQLKTEALRTNQNPVQGTLAEDLDKGDSPIVSPIAAARPGIDRQHILQIESNSFQQIQRGTRGYPGRWFTGFNNYVSILRMLHGLYDRDLVSALKFDL